MQRLAPLNRSVEKRSSTNMAVFSAGCGWPSQIGFEELHSRFHSPKSEARSYIGVNPKGNFYLWTGLWPSETDWIDGHRFLWFWVRRPPADRRGQSWSRTCSNQALWKFWIWKVRLLSCWFYRCSWTGLRIHRVLWFAAIGREKWISYPFATNGI